MLNLFKRYREPLAYLAFGVATTLVNALVYFPARRLLSGWLSPEVAVGVATTLAWVVAVSFAYITNKLWVFENKGFAPRVVLKEAAAFFWARGMSWLLNMAVMLFGVNYLRLNETAVYIAANILVIIFNYVASKLLVFRSKR